nr:unnamed protein product [Digitaria exilis]
MCRWAEQSGVDEAGPTGGYHVLDEAANTASNVLTMSKHMWKPSVRMMEVGIRGAANLLPKRPQGILAPAGG